MIKIYKEDLEADATQEQVPLMLAAGWSLEKEEKLEVVGENTTSEVEDAPKVEFKSKKRPVGEKP